MKLSPKQERFCAEYIKLGNATQAYINAGYSAKTANNSAHALLVNPGIARRVEEMRRQVTKKLLLEVEDILQEAAWIATSDIKDATDPDGKIMNVHEMPEKVRRAVRSIEVTDIWAQGVDIGQKTKLTFWDKNKALEMLAKHKKLLTDKVETDNKNTNTNVPNPELIDMVAEAVAIKRASTDR